MSPKKWSEIKRTKTKAITKLYLDDVRNPGDTYVDGGSWLLCRDIESCKRFLELGLVTHISLDGDMGQNKFGSDIPGGVELLDWMRMTKNWPTKSIQVHSANPVKASQMKLIINEHFQPEEKE